MSQLMHIFFIQTGAWDKWQLSALMCNCPRLGKILRGARGLGLYGWNYFSPLKKKIGEMHFKRKILGCLTTEWHSQKKELFLIAIFHWKYCHLGIEIGKTVNEDVNNETLGEGVTSYNSTWALEKNKWENGKWWSNKRVLEPQFYRLT